MKAHLQAVVAGTFGPLILGPAVAHPNPWPNGVPSAPAPHIHMHNFHGRGFVILDNPEVVHDLVVVHEAPAAAPAPPPPPPPPRKPYVIGRSYAALPGGCMKLLEDKVSYFRCSGDWYRQVAAGYRAVVGPSASDQPRDRKQMRQGVGGHR